MPDIPVVVRGRQYEIACTDDEHEATVTARDMLVHEMQRWISRDEIGIPQLLIMCALSFADQIRNLERQAEESKEQLEALRSSAASDFFGSGHDSEDVNMPEANSTELAELAEYAEEIATRMEESLGLRNEDGSERPETTDSWGA